MNDNRYQHQNGFVRLYRWLRWKPYYAYLATSAIAFWVVTGAKIAPDETDWFPNRLIFVRHLWRCYMSLADFEMQHYYTFEELTHEWYFETP